MNITLPFSKISKKDTALAGGKGASLGEMTQTGIPVPPGFVITAQTFERFLQETELLPEVLHWLSKVNHEDMESVEEASEVLRELILNATIPTDIASEITASFKKLNSTFVAVRSSATAEDSAIDSWAGELETYLNTTQKTLLQNVKQCWASLYSPRAIFYGCERCIYKKESMMSCPVHVAVVVQTMIQSEVSGICFTVHPVTKDKNQMIIEAGYGLGEAIVGGMITPDSYIIDKRDHSILDITVSEQEKMITRSKKATAKNANEWIPVPKTVRAKQKLTGKQIIELATIAQHIEKHYGKPQDIEWAMCDGKFYITQSRPITTLTS